MKVAYYSHGGSFGKVLTRRFKVHSARLPAALRLFYGKIGQLDKKLLLPRETVLLIRNKWPVLDVCSFLHGYRPVIHDQSIHEQSQVRSQ